MCYTYNLPRAYNAPLGGALVVTFLPSREKQIYSLLLLSVGDTDK